MDWAKPFRNQLLKNMVILKRGSKHVLVSKTGRILGTHKSKADAKSQERAIQISKARKAGHRIPKKT